MPYLTYGKCPYNGKPTIFCADKSKAKCTANAIKTLIAEFKINEQSLFGSLPDFLDTPFNHIQLDEPYAVSKQTASNIFKLLVKDITKTLKIKTVPCSSELFGYIEQNDTCEFDNYQGLGYCGWSWEVKKGKAELKADKLFEVRKAQTQNIISSIMECTEIELTDAQLRMDKSNA